MSRSLEAGHRELTLVELKSQLVEAFRTLAMADGTKIDQDFQDLRDRVERLIDVGVTNDQ